MPKAQQPTSLSTAADQTDWIPRLAGRFVVFDGPDGSGKTTQSARFAAMVEAAGVGICRVREPGGTKISEEIRKLLLSRDHEEMVPTCEVLLYMASRAQLVAQQIRPAISRGDLVLADRFISSTLAYQGAAGKVSPDDILTIGRFAVGDAWPDLVVIFDVDRATATKRLTGEPRKRSKKTKRSQEVSLFADRMEAKGDHQIDLIRQGYLDQAKADPERYMVIDARLDEDRIFEALTTAVADRALRWKQTK